LLAFVSMTPKVAAAAATARMTSARISANKHVHGSCNARSLVFSQLAEHDECLRAE
jgi:hypothetical protein